MQMALKLYQLMHAHNTWMHQIINEILTTSIQIVKEVSIHACLALYLYVCASPTSIIDVVRVKRCFSSVSLLQKRL
jgi:hypothetical protein